MVFRVIKKLIILLLTGYIVLAAVSAFILSKTGIDFEQSGFTGFISVNVILSILIFIYSSIMIYFLIIRPLGGFLGFIRNASLDVKADSRALESKKNGFSELFDGFFQYTENLDSIISRLQDMVDRSTEIGESVEGAVKKTAVLNADISDAIDSNKDMMSSLNEEIFSSSDRLRKVQEQIRALNEMITESQSSSVNESTAAIEEMIASINNISKTSAEKKQVTEELGVLTRQGSREMENTLKAINQVSETAGTVMGIVEIINDVSERINLLAMNAAIEAAHAGEAGKGFSVVASEVKKLAEQTGSNVKMISDSISAMKKQMSEAIERTKDTNSSIQRISENITGVTNGMSEIVDGVQEISAGGDQIMKSMQSLMNITEDVKKGSEETDEHMNNVTSSMNNVSELSAKNMKNAAVMGSLVEEIASSVDILNIQGELNAEQLAGIDRELSHFHIKSKEDSFIIGYNDVPPFCMKDSSGKPVGAANDFLVAVLKEMGINSIKYKHIQSLERIYEMLDRNTINAYTLTTRTYDPNPELRYFIPEKPSITPSAGFLMHKDHPLSRITSASDISGLVISTKNGMPLTGTISSSGASIEFIGGEEPLQDCLKMVGKRHFDAVYSIITTELEYMAKQLGIAHELKTVLLPDPPLEIFTGFSQNTSAELLSDFNRAFEKLRREKPFERYLEKYL